MLKASLQFHIHVKWGWRAIPLQGGRDLGQTPGHNSAELGREGTVPWQSWAAALLLCHTAAGWQWHQGGTSGLLPCTGSTCCRRGSAFLLGGDLGGHTWWEALRSCPGQQLRAQRCCSNTPCSPSPRINPTGCVRKELLGFTPHFPWEQELAPKVCLLCTPEWL